MLRTTRPGRAQTTVRASGSLQRTTANQGQERRGDSGATAVEYALLVSLIAGVIIAAVLSLGLTTKDLVNRPCKELAAAGSAC